jgi:CheY-like chemotaxis protein
MIQDIEANVSFREIAAMALVLVIDDDARLRRTMRRILETDHSVLDAADGRAGLKLVHAHRPALVVTDILMPEKEGIETIREMRLLYPGMKIIAISGSGISHGPPSVLAAARALGADAILEKPFHTDELLGMVNELLSSPAAA